MRILVLPDLENLRQLPERGPLTLLIAALDVAEATLRLEHPSIDLEHEPPSARPPTELLAKLLLGRFVELASLVAHYNVAVDDALGCDHEFDLSGEPF